MTSDLHLQDQQEEFEEQQRQQKALEAAVLIQNGKSRESAIQSIQQVYDLRQDASPNEVIYDDDGFPEYLLGEMQTPSIPTDPGKLAQVKAIASEIADQFD